MSKEAKQYQGLTLSQILYGESDDQGHSDHSDDSSVQYVPCTPANHVPRANCDTAESEVSREHAVDPENNYHHAHTLGSTLKRRRPRKRTRTSHSPPARVSSPTQESGPILLTAEHRNTREYTERPRASIRPSKRRRCRQRNSSPGSGSPNVEEHEAHSNELESERNELRELNDHQPIQRHRQNSNQNTPEDGNFEAEEVIDLCSADECEANMFENRTQPSTATNCKQKGSLISEHAPQERVSDIGMTDLRKPEERFEYNANDKSCSKRDDISTLRAAEPYSFPQNECFRPCTNESSTGHDEGVDLDRMEERKKRESPPSPQARIVEEGSKPSANDLTIWNSERQIKSQAQICGEEAGCDPIEERNRKQEIDVKAVENRESSDLVSKPEPVQTHSISPPNLGDDTKPDDPKIVRLRPRRRFKGAKARGTNKPHPDVFRKRVPQSQEEIQAWLAFAKAEARDIHQALTGNVSTERYKCANTDMVFIRQILGELGKLMGLKVHSEKDGTGRRIILERSSHGCVRGSLEEVEQAVEGFFYDALTDLTGQSRTTKQEFRRVPEMKDAIEPSKTSSGLIDGDQVMGEDRNALPRTISPKAPRNCNRRQQRKGKPSPRVARTAPKRKTRSNYRN